MPHFYRYRGDDEDVRAGSRTPAPVYSTSTAHRTDEARIRCLGIGADICIPDGDDTNKMNLNILFYELDKTIQGLKDENKQLRAEVEYLKEISKGRPAVSVPAPAVSVPTPAAGLLVVKTVPVAPVNDGLEERLCSRIEKVESKVEKLAEDLSNTKSQSETETANLQSLLKGLETRQCDHEARVEQTLKDMPAPEVVPAPVAVPAPAAPAAPAEPAPVEPEPETCGGERVDIAQQILEIQESVRSQLSACRSLVSAPLSVIFDAVRSEEWIGQDCFLPFTKLNVNLGGGMDINGKFTAPVSGLYFFAVNVYGAPRDGVVLSIKANEFMEVASCSGVGKASQSCIVDLDEKDTVGVFVNDKSKLVDTAQNRFTHFIGILLRPKEMMYM